MKKIKTYKNFLTEALEINNKFIYEYDKIIVDINSYGDLMNIVDYLERLLNIEIRNIPDSDYYNNNKKYLAIISVKIIHHIIKHDLKTIYFSNILFLYSNSRYNELNDMIDFIEKTVDDNYFNKKHVLNISNLNNIKHLLTGGELTSFKALYLNDKQKSYEGIKTRFIYPYQNIDYIKDLILRGDKPTYKSLYTNKNIYETLTINRENYEYPFRRILIMCESLNEYIESVKYIENILNIDIEDYIIQYIDKGIISLSVCKCYDIIDINNEISEISSWDLFDYFKKRSIDNTNDEFLNYIDRQTSELFFNREDVIRNTSELYKIKKLLINGGVDTFKSIYLKNSEKSYESLLNKLEGPSDDELFKTYNSSNYDELLLSGIWDDNEDAVKYAIEKGADVNNGDILYIAVINASKNIIKLLLDNGADPSYKNYLPLQHAYSKHDQELIDLILKYTDKNSYSYRDYIGDVD